MFCFETAWDTQLLLLYCLLQKSTCVPSAAEGLCVCVCVCTRACSSWKLAEHILPDGCIQDVCPSHSQVLRLMELGHVTLLVLQSCECTILSVFRWAVSQSCSYGQLYQCQAELCIRPIFSVWVGLKWSTRKPPVFTCNLFTTTSVIAPLQSSQANPVFLCSFK